MQKLRDAVAKRPNDLQGQELLARNEARLGNFIAAYQAQQQVIALKGDAAAAEDLTSLGRVDDLCDGRLCLARGRGGPERPPCSAIPTNGTARYYLGLMYAQTGRPDLGLSTVAGAAGKQPAGCALDAANHAARFRKLASGGGSNPTAHRPPMAGPTADDVQAAAEMSR